MSREFTKDEIEVGNKNLDNLVGILRAAQGRGAFYQQGRFFREIRRGGLGETLCGTPACALGHWAAATKPEEEWLSYCQGIGCQIDFALTDTEDGTLFGASGCDYAETPGQAADCIERFVTVRRQAAA